MSLIENVNLQTSSVPLDLTAKKEQRSLSGHDPLIISDFMLLQITRINDRVHTSPPMRFVFGVVNVCHLANNNNYYKINL
jgi:hypothetical protein